jgi:ribosome maturation protein Sdo1
MAPKELVYTVHKSAGDHSTSFVLMVDEETYKKYKTDKSIPLAQVVDSFDILKHVAGRSGLIEKPSKRELEDAFGTKDEDEIVKTILEKGSLH